MEVIVPPSRWKYSMAKEAILILVGTIAVMIAMVVLYGVLV